MFTDCLKNLEELKDKGSKEEVSRLFTRYDKEEHELTSALYALLCKKWNLSYSPIKLNQLESGAILLYERGFFPWGPFPYPREHALLGQILADLGGYEETVLKMAHFQQAFFTHQNKPLSSFFQQEQCRIQGEYEKAVFQFFTKTQVKPKESLDFLDPDLGIYAKRDKNMTLILCASGCKSGMGAFLYQDVGIINFGLQLLPLGECHSFGLMLRAKNFECHKKEEGCFFSFRNQLPTLHTRNTGIPWLADSGSSGYGFLARLFLQSAALHINCNIESFRPVNQIALSFFCTAESCHIGKCRVKPKSLDRYMGPAEDVILKGKNGQCCIQAEKGLSHMQVIPLASDHSFWGADFLVAFFIESEEIGAKVFL